MISDIPREYQQGFTRFLGCHIDLSLRPFIPRPETAQMTEAVIKKIKKAPGVPEIRCLDLFAGSGAIGIALLKHIKNIKVDFGDRDPTCLRQIQINLQENKISPARYGIIKTDIFSGVCFQYHYITANPPYVAEERKEEVQPSVLNFEPGLALFAGPDGLDIIKEFLGQAQDYLKAPGRLFMEFDPCQKKAIEEILKKHNYASWQFFKDSNGLWRWVKINF